MPRNSTSYLSHAIFCDLAHCDCEYSAKQSMCQTLSTAYEIAVGRGDSDQAFILKQKRQERQEVQKFCAR
eukprot:scaffold167267_cov17-Prasinocladus_malaysianus.AAC.2